jgi:N-acylglucosamine 2-epimerase
MNVTNRTSIYKQELLENVIPFWEQHSIDRENGGYFTCLDKYGNVFDTDKFIWLQARQVWLFSMLYNRVEQNPEWLKVAEHGANFLFTYGHDKNFNWYFSLNKYGKPLIQPYNIFSNTFAAMAFSQLAAATNNSEYANIALQTFEKILERKDNPKGIYNKAYPGTRNLKNFALPMILSNLVLEMESLLPQDQVDKVINDAINEVMNVFYKEEEGLLLENVNNDGSFSNTFDGRLLNPGHSLEAMWFIMDLGERLNSSDLIDKAVKISLNTLEYGWDKEHGGIFYFMDIKGLPLQQLEWDQKLWWVHLETLICLLKGYHLTQNNECIEWFEKVNQYTWSHFKDPEYKEWYGYLNRQGKVLLPLKGGKWKGCFHLPRALYQCWRTLEKIEKLNIQ